MSQIAGKMASAQDDMWGCATAATSLQSESTAFMCRVWASGRDHWLLRWSSCDTHSLMIAGGQAVGEGVRDGVCSAEARVDKSNEICEVKVAEDV
jgi:hypothetical protein